jgi:hypothetical protein
MHYRYAASVAIVAGIIASNSAQANVRVGGAVSVVRDVSGSLSGKSWEKKTKGDDVQEKEFIHTAPQSSTAILFVDKTHVRVGQAATVRIVRAVLDSSQSNRELELNVESGAVRWISGDSVSSAYKVETPTAIITTEGTTFDLVVESERTMVVLRSGRIKVCAIDAPRRCETLSRRDDMIVATRNDLEGPRRGRIGPSEFANQCLSADVMTPCIITAGLNPRKSGAVTPDDASTRPRVVDRGPSYPRGEPTPRVVDRGPSYPRGEPTPRVVDRGPTYPRGEPNAPTTSLDLSVVERMPTFTPTPSRNCYPYRGRLVCRSLTSPSYPPNRRYANPTPRPNSYGTAQPLRTVPPVYAMTPRRVPAGYGMKVPAGYGMKVPAGYGMKMPAVRAGSGRRG